MAALPPDPYKVLGVSKDAQIPDIRSAHRKLVLKCHPDKVQDPDLKALKQDEFQKVQQAYELLSDDKERQRYDDQVHLAELRKQAQNRANTSATRSPRYAAEYEVRTAEPRPSTFASSPAASPATKTYTYSRSWEEDIGRGPRIFDTEFRTTRRQASYTEKPTKREQEREREKERERDREKDRDRERRRRAKEREIDDSRRAEKEEREARKAAKKVREKQRDKEIKRETDDKRRYAKPYIEPYEEDIPIRSVKKKASGGKKYEEKRERSSPREASPAMSPPPAMPAPSLPQERTYVKYEQSVDWAHSYIGASRSKPPPGLQRAATYHPRQMQPPAPTPPPAPGKASSFAVPDDEEVRRSSARRRDTGDSPLPRERTYRRASRDPIDEPVVVDSGSPRPPAGFRKSASPPVMSSSPPQRSLPRTNTMPVEPGFNRPMPNISRAQTFSGGFPEGPDPRGRGRSRMQPQVEEYTDSDEEYERRAARDRKHRSKKHRSPDAMRPETLHRYQVDGGRAKLHSSYSRQLDLDEDSYRYLPNPRVVEVRPPPMPTREGSYMGSGSGSRFPKVKTSKDYSLDDAQYSKYESAPPRREEFSAYA